MEKSRIETLLELANEKDVETIAEEVDVLAAMSFDELGIRLQERIGVVVKNLLVDEYTVEVVSEHTDDPSHETLMTRGEILGLAAHLYQQGRNVTKPKS